MKANHLKTLLPMLTAVLILGGCGNTNTTQTDILETNNAEQIETEHVTENTEISLDEQTETEETPEEIEVATEETEGMNGNGAGDVYIPTEEDLAIEDEATLAQQEAQEADEQLESESEENVVDYTVESIDEKTMYAQQSVNLRQGPSTEYDKVGSLSKNQSVTVTGKVTMNNGTWYQLSTGEFVSANYLGADKVATQTPTNTDNGSGNSGGETTGGGNSGGNQSSEGEDVSGATGDGSGSSRENRGGGSSGEGTGVGMGNLH